MVHVLIEKLHIVCFVVNAICNVCNFRGVIVAGVVSGIVGGLIGSWISSNRLTKKHNKEKEELLRYIEYQDELYKLSAQQWQTEYQKLYKAYEEIEKETVERDYEEFKAPDTDNDDLISREEFNVYVKKYLSSFPELSEKDFPRFEEFDLNADGIVSFEEWQTYLYQQKLKESQAVKAGNSGSNGGYNDLMNALYESTNQADNFQGLQKNIASNARGTRRA